MLVLMPRRSSVGTDLKTTQRYAEALCRFPLADSQRFESAPNFSSEPCT